MIDEAPGVPSDFSFFQLARLLEQFFPDAPPLGSARDAARERVRFGALDSMGFPPADIAHIGWQPRAADLPDIVRVTVTFLGLYGPSSPLPDFHTERVLQDDDLDGSLRSFYDLFNHRLTALLYQCWAKYRYYLRFEDGGKDSMSRAVFALAGLQVGAGSGEPGLEWVRLLGHAGLLGFNSCSPRVLEQLISHYFDVPARVEEGVQRYVSIAPEQRNRLGHQSSTVGDNWVLGGRVADISGKFRVWLGPLDRAQFDALAPGTAAHQTLFHLIRQICRDSLDFDVRVLVQEGDIEPWRLGGDDAAQTVPLGRLIWLGNTAAASLGISLSAPGVA